MLCEAVCSKCSSFFVVGNTLLEFGNKGGGAWGADEKEKEKKLFEKIFEQRIMLTT